MGPIWFDTNEVRDVLHSLRHSLFCAQRASDAPDMWKWSIVAMHNALQGAMVCHLSGTMQLGALTLESGQKWHSYLQHDRSPELKMPATKIAPIGVLFERVTTGQQMIKGIPAPWLNDAMHDPIAVSQATKRSFNMLANLRNGLVHFSPRIWSIEVSGLWPVLADLAEFIRQIYDFGWAFRHLALGEREEFLKLLEAFVGGPE